MPELIPDREAHDVFRSELCRPRIQIPLWVTLALVAAGVVCSTLAWATGDSRVGLAGTIAWALFIPAVLLVERAVSRKFRETLSSNGPHGPHD